MVRLKLIVSQSDVRTATRVESLINLVGKLVKLSKLENSSPQLANCIVNRRITRFLLLGFYFLDNNFI